MCFHWTSPSNRGCRKIRLKEFSENDTKDYIKHRLSVAGCPKDIFSDEAIKLLYEVTNGVPRLINTVCDNALLEGYLAKVNTLDSRIVQTVRSTSDYEAGLNDISFIVNITAYFISSILIFEGYHSSPILSGSLYT